MVRHEITFMSSKVEALSAQAFDKPLVKVIL
jgi:hypothetical protein